jgi:hypothetical protein
VSAEGEVRTLAALSIAASAALWALASRRPTTSARPEGPVFTYRIYSKENGCSTGEFNFSPGDYVNALDGSRASVSV